MSDLNVNNATGQRTYEWFQARCGKVTASRFKDVLSKLKNGNPSQARKDYLIEIVSERLTGVPTSRFVTPAMQWGTDQEPFAKTRYTEITGRTIDDVGFITHPQLMTGASPDGLVDLEGLIEIKCPTTATHLETLLEGMPASHAAQIQGQLWITGAPWADFVSFDPRLPAGMDTYIQRVERDDGYIAMLESEIRIFLGEVDAFITILKDRQQ